jgi:S-adenosylmethionine-diacylglycerol 3-amino-3-carboxypropyl transferase
MSIDVAGNVDFSFIRYGQCWEDADVLLEGLQIRPGDRCLSIASAGDNTLALLTQNPAQVTAIDVSAPQLFCLELRVAAYRELSHAELLQLIGSTPSNKRLELYQRCRRLLSPAARAFWDRNAAAIKQGIGASGKLERYLRTFRNYLLPFIHQRARRQSLLSAKSSEERRRFFHNDWNNWRWRFLFRLFFSKPILARWGRDPALFQHVNCQVGEELLERAARAMTELDPAENPYLQWMIDGRHTRALPVALRPESFDTIRANLDRLSWQQISLGDFLSNAGGRQFEKYNLSDVFEYMDQPQYEKLLEMLIHCGVPGGRALYWNLFVPRSRPERLAKELLPLADHARALHARDKAFVYRRLVLEEIG